jgi:HD superfamily phosphodiesterase
MTIIEKAKNFYCEEIVNLKRFAKLHRAHVEELEKLIEGISLGRPEADKEILLLAVWLHDIGFIRDGGGDDHAITGEIIAREWLEKEGYDKNKAERVLHCVRSHRCKDVQPETLEAKIIAFADSASHMTQGIYIDMLKEEREGSTYDPLQKLERDWRDLSFFPEMKNKFEALYEAWRKLIEAYREINIK